MRSGGNIIIIRPYRHLGGCLCGIVKKWSCLLQGQLLDDDDL